MKKKREAQTEKQSHLHREISKLVMNRKREAETEEEKYVSGKKISLQRQDTIRQ